jgi:hypothetical protein
MKISARNSETEKLMQKEERKKRKEVRRVTEDEQMRQ